MTATPWELTNLLIHALSVMGLMSLWGGAPDRIQKAVIFLLLLSLGFYIIIDAIRLASGSGVVIDPNLYRSASLPMQYGVMLFIARLWQQKRNSSCKRQP